MSGCRHLPLVEIEEPVFRVGPFDDERLGLPDLHDRGDVQVETVTPRSDGCTVRLRQAR